MEDMPDLKEMLREAKRAIEKAGDWAALWNLEIKYLGRKGLVTGFLRSLKDLSLEKRKVLGKRANELKQELQSLFDRRSAVLKEKDIKEKLAREKIDITAPGRKIPRGHLHPVTSLLREAIGIFSSLGFAVAEGPEIETEWYNFEALNIPKHHPARDLWSTLWLKPPSGFKFQDSGSKLLMRTHTSPVQIRFMQSHNPPFHIISPGIVYRYEATDASHEIQFHQIEGLMAGKDISAANFRYVIESFFSRFFRKDVKIRMRPSFFPFVEPGFEVDMSCISCSGRGCPVCKRSGWVEIMGAGMVHPNVFKAAGHNPKELQGFAFGIGFDRLVMMRYKIPDIRLFHSQDLRFIKQF